MTKKAKAQQAEDDFAHFSRHKRKQKFLQNYAKLGNIARSAKAAGIARRSHYDWLESDSEYKAGFEIAREISADVLEQEAWRRALTGTERPVFWKGVKCGTVREYSNVLLIFLLKAARPQRFREHFTGDVRVEQVEQPRLTIVLESECVAAWEAETQAAMAETQKQAAMAETKKTN